MTHPIDRVVWRHRDTLRANNYNPNHVAPSEMNLLATSILEDGWTQPVVLFDNSDIGDGFHRWTVAGYPEVYALTDGMVPTVMLPPGRTRAQQMMTTVRHNRARGTHGVLPMADIVAYLLHEQELAPAIIADLLGMDMDEINRLADRGDMRKRGRAEGFTKGWKPG